jgi:hypothetical protein
LGLFNDDISISVYIASNGRKTDEHLGKEVEGSNLTENATLPQDVSRDLDHQKLEAPRSVPGFEKGTSR